MGDGSIAENLIIRDVWVYFLIFLLFSYRGIRNAGLGGAEVELEVGVEGSDL